MSHDSYDLTVYYDSSKWYTMDTLGPNAYFGVYYFQSSDALSSTSIGTTIKYIDTTTEVNVSGYGNILGAEPTFTVSDSNSYYIAISKDSSGSIVFTTLISSYSISMVHDTTKRSIRVYYFQSSDALPSGSLPIKSFNIVLSNVSFSSSGTWYKYKTYSCEFKRFLGVSGSYSFNVSLNSSNYACSLVVAPSGYDSSSSASSVLILSQAIKSSTTAYSNSNFTNTNDNCVFGSGFDIIISAGGGSLVATVSKLTMNLTIYYF